MADLSQVSTDDLMKMLQQHPQVQQSAAPESTGSDILKSISTGLAQGVASLADLPDLVMPLGSVSRNVANATLAAQGSKEHIPSTSETLLNLLQNATGQLHQPQTVPGQYARTIASFAPAAVAGPEGIVPKIASAVIPGTLSEAAGQATQGTPYESAARTAAALIGGPLSGVRARLPQAPSLLGDVSPETADLFQKMNALGINVRPAQAAPSGFVKTADSELQRLPFTGYGNGNLPTNQQQIAQTTQALLKTTGSNAKVASDAAMATIKKNLGDTYNGIFNRNSITLTPDFHDTLNEIGREAQTNLLGDTKTPETIQLIQKKAQDNGGTLTGQQYQNMRQKGGPIYQIANSSDPGIAYWGNKLRSALDNEFANQADPSDAALLRKTNQQYQNYKILEPIADKAAVGQLSPQLLLQQVNLHGGSGDIQDIARGSQAFLKEPANSMTAERGTVLRALSHPATLAGGLTGLGTVVGGSGGGILALPLALMTSRALKNAVNSQAARRQLLSGGVPQPAPPMLSYAPPTPLQLTGQAAIAGNGQ